MDKGKSKGSERAVPFHIARMPQALKAALAVEAGYMGMSMAEVARIAIAKLIKEKEAERRAAALLKAGRTTEA